MTSKYLSEEHPELFHYTNEKGLFGILDTQYLRATHWQHLNDSKELMHFDKELHRIIEGELVQLLNNKALGNSEKQKYLNDHGGIEVFCSDTAKIISDELNKPLKNNDEGLFEFYMTSFCTPLGSFHEVKNHGLLSQWRYYGQQGGYALVFDTVQLENLIALELQRWSCVITFREVFYSSDSQEVLEKLNKPFIEAFKKLEFDSPEGYESILEPLQDCIINYKHWAFAEEKEVRLVVRLKTQSWSKNTKLLDSLMTSRSVIIFAEMT